MPSKRSIYRRHRSSSRSPQFPRWFRQYGLGVSLLLAVLVVQFHDHLKSYQWRQSLGVSDFDMTGERLATVEDWQTLLAPQQFTVEQHRLVDTLMSQLKRLGVSVKLDRENHSRYGGVWSPSQQLIRMNPSVLQSPEVLLKVLSHESIHVAQSCRPNMTYGVNSRPLGLPIDPQKQRWVDQSPAYQKSPGNLQVEYEAFTYDQYPEFVIELLQKYCR